MQMLAAFTSRLSWLDLRVGRPPNAQSAFIIWTGWTLPRSQHHKHYGIDSTTSRLHLCKFYRAWSVCLCVCWSKTVKL